jgi:alpha-mannosidase
MAKEVPAQISNGKVLFPAKRSFSRIRSLRRAAGGFVFVSGRPESHRIILENSRYRVTIDKKGDVASIFDKQINRELLSAPIRLAISTDNPSSMALHGTWTSRTSNARRGISSRAMRRFASSKPGPVRVALEVERQTEGSKFVQTVRLSTGEAGNRVEFSNVIDWATKEANLKAVFPLSAANNLATYNWDVGTIQRPNEAERQFEVASHQWIDLTDKAGTFGATVLTDCKNASDKPDDRRSD